MISDIRAHVSKVSFHKIYILALVFYLLPLISLVIFIVDQLTVNKTDMIFWLIFLLGLIPCGLIGFILSAIGLVITKKSDILLNKILGIIGVVGGFIMLVGGIFGLMLIYLVIGG